MGLRLSINLLHVRGVLRDRDGPECPDGKPLVDFGVGN